MLGGTFASTPCAGFSTDAVAGNAAAGLFAPQSNMFAPQGPSSNPFVSGFGTVPQGFTSFASSASVLKPGDVTVKPEPLAARVQVSVSPAGPSMSDESMSVGESLSVTPSIESSFSGSRGSPASSEVSTNDTINLICGKNMDGVKGAEKLDELNKFFQVGASDSSPQGAEAAYYNGLNVRVTSMIFKVSCIARIDLLKFAQVSSNVEYRPKRFPGAVVKLSRGLPSCAAFRNGTLLAIGAADEHAAAAALKKVFKMIHKASAFMNPTDASPKDDFKPSLKYFHIVNIMAELDVQSRVDLPKLSSSDCLTGVRVNYEPSQGFPGLILSIEGMKGTVVVFATGKCNISGCKNKEAVSDIARATASILENFKIGDSGVRIMA